MAAYKQAKEAAGADGIVDAALRQATSVPLAVAEHAHEVSKVANSLFAITNPNMKSDLTTAIALAGAAIEGAVANVEINLESMKDEAFVEQTRRRVAAVKQGANSP
jgi:formiminotetrahydrofolate cyclodeaminase